MNARTTRHTHRPRLLRHAPFIVVLLGLLGATFALFSLWLPSVDQQVRDAERVYGLRLQALDGEIAMITARHDAESTAKKAADAKETAAKIAANPSQSLASIDPASCNISSVRNDPSRIDVLVNKKHCLQPLSFAPSDLITVNGATISQKAAPDFQALMNAASEAGYPLAVTSSYRSYQTQVSTYNYWVSISGVAVADTYSARPGYSEHQTGLAIDFATTDGCALSCFAGTAEYAWLRDNAHRFGFIQRYVAGQEAITGYQAEEWHYRYVGKTVASEMKASDTVTLEAFWNLPGGGY